MERHLKHLSKEQQGFIDLVYNKKKTFQEAAENLNVAITIIRQFNNDLDSTWRPIAEIRKKWKSKEDKSIKEWEIEKGKRREENPEYLKEISDEFNRLFWDFYDWDKRTEKSCHYCHVTQDELNRLHLVGIINNRPTRGKTFEIDRKEPKKGYNDISNLTYACYWCNNAKTDTFTEDEFMLIGQAISKVWKQRLKNDNR